MRDFEDADEFPSEETNEEPRSDRYPSSSSPPSLNHITDPHISSN